VLKIQKQIGRMSLTLRKYLYTSLLENFLHMKQALYYYIWIII